MLSIALVLIVRNEQRCIERCINSIKPYVDEVVVLDTGSTDNTVAIAKELGAKVHSFHWCDDFSAARNKALDYADSDWNLVIDADEWLVSGASILQQLKLQKPDFVGRLCIQSEAEVDGVIQYSAALISRVLPRKIRYKGTIHEQPIHSLPTKVLDINFAHDGYGTAQKKKKHERNLTLLLREIKTSPESAYLNYQLGVEYELIEKYAQAISYYYIAKQKSIDSDPWRLALILRMLYCLKKLGKLTTALKIADEEKKEYSLICPDFYFVLGDIYLDAALTSPSLATSLIAKIEQCWLNCLAIGDKPKVSGTVLGRGSYLAAHNLAVFYSSIKKQQKASQFFALASSLKQQAEKNRKKF